MKWQANPIKLNAQDQVVGASATQPISQEFSDVADVMTHGIRIDAVVSAVTVGAGVSIRLQHAFDPSDGTTPSWSDVDATLGRVAVAAAGTVSILLHPGVAAHAAILPLRARFRVVAVTGAASAVTVTDLQALADNLTVSRMPARSV